METSKESHLIFNTYFVRETTTFIHNYLLSPLTVSSTEYLYTDCLQGDFVLANGNLSYNIKMAA